MPRSIRIAYVMSAVLVVLWIIVGIYIIYTPELVQEVDIPPAVLPIAMLVGIGLVVAFLFRPLIAPTVQTVSHVVRASLWAGLGWLISILGFVFVLVDTSPSLVRFVPMALIGVTLIIYSVALRSESAQIYLRKLEEQRNDSGR